jgi:hypothetical protein
MSTDIADTVPPLAEFFPLSEAAKHWPEASGGRRLHKHTCFRWASSGVNGVKLRVLRVPGVGLMTHPRWVHEFVVAVNAARLASGRCETVTTSRRRRSRGARTDTSAALARFKLPSGA